LKIDCDRVFVSPGNAELESLSRVAKALSNLGFSDTSLQEVERTRRKFQSAETALHLLVERLNQSEIPELNDPSDINTLHRIFSIVEGLSDASQRHLNESWEGYLSDKARECLAKIRSDCENLKKKEEELSEIFDLNQLPSSREFNDLIKTIRQHHGSLFSFFSSEYRSARKTTLGFLKNPSDWKRRDFPIQLGALQTCLEESVKIGKTPSHVQALGPLFRGINTDWKHLESRIDWGKRFSDDCRTGNLSAQLLRNRREILNKVGDFQELNHLMDDINAGLDALETLNIPQSDRLREIPLGRFRELNTSIGNKLNTALQTLVPTLNGSHWKLHNIEMAITRCREMQTILASLRDQGPLERIVLPYFERLDESFRSLAETSNWLNSLRENGVPDSLITWRQL
jgi:hypothetical protein